MTEPGPCGAEAGRANPWRNVVCPVLLEVVRHILFQRTPLAPRKRLHDFLHSR